MSLRWEWRTFGDELSACESRLGTLDPERITESDEMYLLASPAHDAVKVRGGLMDVKHLERVDDDGLELWKPVMKSRLPISAADTRVVLAALRVPAVSLDRGAYDLADLADAAAGAVVVPVHKRRRHFSLNGCMAELTDLRAAGRSTRTIAIESEQPARLITTVRELGFDPPRNINVPHGLKALLAS